MKREAALSVTLCRLQTANLLTVLLNKLAKLDEVELLVGTGGTHCDCFLDGGGGGEKVKALSLPSELPVEARRCFKDCGEERTRRSSNRCMKIGAHPPASDGASTSKSGCAPWESLTLHPADIAEIAGHAAVAFDNGPVSCWLTRLSFEISSARAEYRRKATTQATTPRELVAEAAHCRPTTTNTTHAHWPREWPGRDARSHCVAQHRAPLLAGHGGKRNNSCVPQGLSRVHLDLDTACAPS